MKKNLFRIKKDYIALVIVGLLLAGVFLPATQSKTNIDNLKGFDKGLSYKPVVPIKKITMVQFDENNILDDYAYLAAVPTAVFSNGNKLYSNPLLFYQDEYQVKEDKDRSLNARQGINYFMEDWMAYCNGQLDQMTLINVPKNKLDSSWKAKEYTTIESDNPYDIANKIALSEWSYSDNAVVAVIQDQFEKINTLTQGTVSGSVLAYTIGHQHFDVQKPVIGVGGTYTYFDINDKNYKYIVAELTWSNHVDYDLQLYDDKLGMVDNLARGFPEVPKYGLVEVVGSYIHNYGKWGVSVTAVPVKNVDQTTNDNQDGPVISSLKDLAKAIKDTGDVDITLYPGTIINIPQSPFGCRDIDFTLTWNNPDTTLGFTLLDPTGTEICSSLSKEEVTSGEVEKTSETTSGEASVHVDRLGECRGGENYSICVFSLNEIVQPLDFTLEYSWHQNFSKTEGEYFTSASNGAVLASTLNAPLLYISPSQITSATKDTLYKLGVKNIYLINIGNHLSKDVKTKLNDIDTINEYSEASDLYKAINEKTGNTKTTVFTTIDPWTYWYTEERIPAGEYPGALFVGPAAFIAAQHGSPVVTVELHPQLSQATVYPTDFWVKNAKSRDEPTSGSMLLSGKEVYNFLEENDLGKLEPGKAADQIQETIITVAGQFDIGGPWDRMFTGAALNGRFCFSPVDTAYWISRNVFYPAMIYVNPAMQGENTYINGSSSVSKLIGGRIQPPYGSTLVVTPSPDTKFTYPVLQTYTAFSYKFNEFASKVWGFKYTTADGIIPYESPSPDPIDDGATDKAGAYYPDMSESEVIPFYVKRAGYDNVFSTNFDATVENLNRGVIIWVECCHGGQNLGGVISMWDPNNPYIHEENPWRAYEPILLYPGHWKTFPKWIIYVLSGCEPSLLTKELIKFHILPEIGSTKNPDVAVQNFNLILINKIAEKLNLPLDFWGANGIMLYRDRLKHPLQAIKEDLPLVNIYDGDGKVTISPRSGQAVSMAPYYGIDFDNALKNIHSCGLNTISCLPAYTYLSMTWMRHGMTYQIIDPWTTTDWAGVWNQMLIKLFAEGYTVGQAYELGMRACGPEFLVGQWWWDKWENVCLFGDPSLRVFVPGTDYSDANYWTQKDTQSVSYDSELNIQGHMPYGATSYPHARQPEKPFLEKYIWYIAIIIIVILIIILIAASRSRKKPKKK